ncbi:MAG: ATP-binding protein [Spirochaetales bacterium]|nr:ATP-binding protein [Spirochaetales bacterium]
MISKLTTRLLVFNILLVFFPIGALLYLDTYEKQLLESMESAMVQQGRLVSAALRDREDLKDEALRLLKNMEGHQNARIRIVDSQGYLLADSSSPSLQPAPHPEKEVRVKYSRMDSLPDSLSENMREHWLYRAAVYPLNLFKSLFFPPSAPLGSAEYYSGSSRLMGPELERALSGQYGAYTRYSSGGQRSVNLYSALPVFREGEVNGAVLISRSTYRILSDLYSLRLDMVRVFIYSVLAAVLLSALLARTITIPVKKLRDQAESFLDHRGRVKGEFRSLKNRDEIGDLSRVLDGLSASLSDYIRFMDGFSADLSHELKNPVAGILNAAELSLEAEGEDRERFLGMIRDEGLRIQRLISDLREISQVDLKLSDEPAGVVDLNALIRNLIRQRNLTLSIPVFEWEDTHGMPLYVRGDKDRLVQCFSNIFDNALSFSPAGEPVLVKTVQTKDRVVLSVLDRGPGIPEGNLDKLFNRFFSDRPLEDRNSHSGLGLSIAHAVVKAYRGELTAANRDGGGAEFKITLPVVPVSPEHDYRS